MTVTDLVAALKTIAPKGKDISKTTLDRCQDILEELIKTDEGHNAVLSAVVEGSIHRQVLIRLLAAVEKTLPQETLAPEVKTLLRTVVDHENVNSPALWLALSSYCSRQPADTKVVLKCSLAKLREPLKEAAGRYEKFAFPHLKPDGMLALLLDVMASASETELRWLAPMTECAARKLLEAQSLDGLTINALRAQLERIASSASWQPSELARLIALLASRHINVSPALREVLLAAKPRIEQAPGQTWSITLRKIDEALGLAIPEVTTGIAQREIVSLSRKLAISEVLRQMHHTLVDESRGLGEVLTQVQQLEESLRTAAEEKARLKAEAEASRAEQAALVTERDTLSAKAHALENELREVSNALLQAQRETAKALSVAKAAEEHARQDVGLAKADAEHSLATFRFALWHDLRASFVEAMDEAYKNNPSLPTEVRILLGRLCDALSALRKHGVTS